MEILYIYIAGAVLVAVIATLLIAKKLWKTSDSQLMAEQLKVENDKLQVEINSHILDIESVNKKKASLEIKLKELEEERSYLENQLQNVITGSPEAVTSALTDEVQRHKKKIKSLNDKIEELDDDKEELKKNLDKLKNVKMQCEELQDALRCKDKEIKVVKEDLERLQDELQDVEADREVKSESIKFVQDILVAEELVENQVDYDKINRMVDFIKDDLKSNVDASLLLQKGYKELFSIELYRWANMCKKSWIAGKTTIAFVGEFSAGKTSIVNRILSQDDSKAPQLPVSAKAATAIPTYISGGVKTNFEFVAPDSTRKKISEESFKNIKKEVLDQIKGISSLITYFVMSYKNDKLKNLSILDTPGFNSSDKEDAERTIGVINECDALFWVIDVNAGTANKSSINLIKEHLKKPLYIVINKVDTKASSEVDKAEKKIKEDLEKDGVEVMGYIRFSGKEPIESIMNPIKLVKRDMDQDRYLDRITELTELHFQSLKVDATEKENNYKMAKQSYDSSVTSFTNVVNQMVNSCRAAQRIPQEKKGTTFIFTFSEDRYEMPKAEGARMLGMLSDIANNQSNALKRQNTETSESAKNVQSKYEAYAVAQSKKNKFSDLMSKYNNLKKSIN